MRPKRVNIWLVLTVLGGMIYPAVVYVSLPQVSPFILAAVGLGLIAMRMWGVRRSGGASAWIPALAIVAATLAALSVVSPGLAVKAYPAMISVAAASVFGASLIWPPNLIERIARLKEPDLSLQGQIYTRRVTQVWTSFLLINAGISGATAFWGSPEQWMLWNGLISYLLMGVLFVGEIALRQYVRRRI
jgi:uncharacterized membrane protein